MDAVVRFEAKRNSPNERGCREWNAGTDSAGYGSFWLEGKRVAAHRFAFFLARGYWPEECRHTCDNPPCTEPAHLLDGTHADNMRDMVERGRNWVPGRRVVCPSGHAARYDAFGHCMTCGNERRRAAYRRKVGTVTPLPAQRTSCPAGHPYDEANTYTYRGKRMCRACRARRVRNARKAS